MATAEPSTLDNIAQFDDFYNTQSGPRVNLATYGVDEADAELEAEISNLEDRVRQQNAKLEEIQRQNTTQLSAITAPARDLPTRLRQLRAVKAAYDHLISTPPDIPVPGSRVPAVLAADAIKKSIAVSQSAINSAVSQLQSAEDQAKVEEGNLFDARTLSDALDLRLVNLESTQHEQRGQPVVERYRKILTARMKRANDYRKRSKALRGDVDEFITEQLGAMLLAEELGGPVVGELAEVDEDMLTAGFSKEGKPRKSKPGSDSRRQLRLDELWGFGNRDEEDVAEPESEQQAAVEDMLGLIDALYAALQGTSDTGTYVELHRDSAATRYLVRAKVAQYHPRDARRLRLIDFGRELD